MLSKKIISIFVFFTFFILSTLTLKDYGINWDTINHLPRGQAYLHYYLTGSKDYQNLPKYEWYWQDPSSLSIKADQPEKITGRSMYQLGSTDFNWYMENDGSGHPPLSDILSSAFNRVLFGKLRIINDIDSYRVYGTFLASLLLVLIFWWGSRAFGKIGGLIAAISLATYPLFWSETHFNTEKDIPETVYISFMLYSVWRGINGKSSKWILISGVFFGLALGTKFNVLFTPFIILPWLAFHLFSQKKITGKRLKEFITKKKAFLLSIFLAPIIGALILFASWPYLWQNPLKNTLDVFKFYKTIGLTQSADPRFTGIFNINTYPLYWILYTTPIPTLILFFAGLLFSIKKIIFEKNATVLLFLLWLTVPILRVIAPKTTIYGGVRQIMEYIPALSLIAGLGASALLSYAKSKFAKKAFLVFVLLILLIPNTYVLYKTHPSQNTYFNEFAGGLSGAREKDIPSWGNTFGAAYRKGVEWINKNAEPDAQVVFAHELFPNVPRIFWRQDLIVWNVQRSGYLRNGEYAITLTYDNTSGRSYYDAYLNKFIKPVYELKSQGVPVLKVWKNSDEYLIAPWKEIEYKDFEVEKTQIPGELVYKLEKESSLARLELTLPQVGCAPLENAHFEISKDGEVYHRLPGNLPRDWLIPVIGQQPDKRGKLIQPFTGEKMKFIRIKYSPLQACIGEPKTSRLFVFE